MKDVAPACLCGLCSNRMSYAVCSPSCLEILCSLDSSSLVYSVIFTRALTFWWMLRLSVLTLCDPRHSYYKPAVIGYCVCVCARVCVCVRVISSLSVTPDMMRNTDLLGHYSPRRWGFVSLVFLSLSSGSHASLDSILALYEPRPSLPMSNADGSSCSLCPPPHFSISLSLNPSLFLLLPLSLSLHFSLSPLWTLISLLKSILDTCHRHIIYLSWGQEELLLCKSQSLSGDQSSKSWIKLQIQYSLKPSQIGRASCRERV